MKTIITTVLALLAGGLCQAQGTEVIYSEKPREVKTLMKSDGGFGGHLSMNVKGTQIYDQSAVMVGGELVFTLNHALNIGVAGYGMPTRVDYMNDNGIFTEDLYLEMGYGGLLIEPVFFDQSVIHFTVPVLIGGGWTGLSNVNLFNDAGPYDQVFLTDQSVFFVLEPGINMEANLVKNVKFTLGASYRYINGSSLRGITDEDLSGGAITAGIRVGWF